MQSESFHKIDDVCEATMMEQEALAEAVVQAEKALERVQNFDADTLAREKTLGEAFSFSEAVEPARRTVLLLKQIDLKYLKEFPNGWVETLRRVADAFYKTLQDILTFSAKDPGAAEARVDLIEKIRKSYSETFSEVADKISYISSQQRDFAALEREARAATQAARDMGATLTQELVTSRDEAQKVLAAVRQTAAEQGVSQEAVYFKQEADHHEQGAKKWLRATVGSVAFGFTLAVLSLFVHKSEFFSPKNTYETVQLAASKLLILGSVALFIVLASRTYLAHTHNSVVNRHRQNALLTFNSLVEAAKGEDRKDIILTQAAACIFAPQETGFSKHPSGGDIGGVKLLESPHKASTTAPP
jgi:hypothetical protein